MPPHVTKNDKGRSSNVDRKTRGSLATPDPAMAGREELCMAQATGPLRQVKCEDLRKRTDWSPLVAMRTV